MLAGARDGSVIAVASTIAPQTMQRIAAKLPASPKVALLDIPLCRGEGPAQEGKLLIMGGGDRAAFDACRPAFAAFATSIHHLGPVGAGQVGKMVNNLILWACISANEEGFKLAHKLGVERETLRAALLDSSAGNWSLETRPEERPMPWAEKDMTIVLKEADAARLSLPLCGVVKEVDQDREARTQLADAESARGLTASAHAVQGRQITPERTRMKLARLLAFARDLLAVAGTASAQTYPDRPITLVVPYPAGGGNDVLGRLVAERMSKVLGGTIVVENRGGAGGTIATRQVAKSPPDGYTMLIATSSLAINPSLYPNVGYDPMQGFRADRPAGVGRQRRAGASVGAGELHPGTDRAGEEGSRQAQLRLDRLRIERASRGRAVRRHGRHQDQPCALSRQRTGAQRSARRARHHDVRDGAVGAGIVKGGKVRALAVTSAKRSVAFPELPTIAEAGLAGYVAELHYGLVAPAGTPRPIIDKLNAALRAALEDSTLRERLAREGAVPLPSTPEEYAADIAAEERMWGKIVRDAGVKGE